MRKIKDEKSTILVVNKNDKKKIKCNKEDKTDKFRNIIDKKGK